MTTVGYAAADNAVAHLFVAELADRVAVDGNEGRHLARVRRLRAGERVTAADGAGTWRAYEVGVVAGETVELHAAGAPAVEPEPLVTIGIAPALRKGGLEEVAARVTELGVARIAPVATARAVARWDDERARAAVTRLRAIVREAAMQCRRARVPEVDPLAPLHEIASRPGLVLADRAGSGPHELDPPGAEGWTVVSGPEGGFDPSELALLAHAPRLAVGPHVLRAETAPVAAVAALVARASPLL